MVIKKELLASILFLIVSFSNAQVQQLNPQQKVKDFLYAYEVLSDNYPFFGMLERETGINWLNQKQEYVEWIRKTEDDRGYISTLNLIFEELNDGHVNFNATRYGNEGVSDLYKKASLDDSHYLKWVEMFDNPNSRIDYWSNILKEMESPQVSTKRSSDSSQKAHLNYSDMLLENGEIAIMTIRSFNFHKIDEDKELIDRFLEKIGECKYLIIDIQENSGGATSYWVENIVERLLQKPVVNTTYPVIKESDINRHFYSDFFKEAKLLKETETLLKIPPELLREGFYIKVSKDTIEPNDPFQFTGEIFLLVSGKVFSSSEGFAQFCKTTGWATVAGVRTGGDGIGSDPVLILLPESGILMGIPSLVGLNHDGSLNAEEKTTPDLIFTGASSEERLNKLIHYLKTRR